MGDRLRATWDFDDLDSTEERFRTMLDEEHAEADRAEVLTQLARVAGLRGQFETGHALIDEAERRSSAATVRARALLERGRLHRSRGDAPTALPLFESAFEVALAAGEDFLAVDAAHMAALAAPGRAEMVASTTRGIELAEGSDDPDVTYWLGPLLNNLGWEYYAAGDYDAALDAFRRALEVRDRDPEKPQAREIARYAVGKTLRALGRFDEAAQMLEEAVAWAERSGKPDGWFHEELAEIYAGLGRQHDARAQAKRAVALLVRADPSFEGDADRSRRLRLIAGETDAG